MKAEITNSKNLNIRNIRKNSGYIISIKFNCAIISEIKGIKMGSEISCDRANAIGIVIGIKANKTISAVFMSGKRDLREGTVIHNKGKNLSTKFSMNFLGKIIKPIL